MLTTLSLFLYDKFGILLMHLTLKKEKRKKKIILIVFAIYRDEVESLSIRKILFF